MITTLFLTLAGLASQESAPLGSTPAEGEVAKTATAEELRSRIHGMRMDLLLGGDRVRDAETEAIEFYGQKRELVDQRLDSIGAELSEKRATYDVVMGRALSETTPEARSKALNEAVMLRAEISSLENEAASLAERRNRLRDMVGAVEARDRQRQKLAADLETGPGSGDLAWMPMAGIGLAPDTGGAVVSDPLANEALVEDLLRRDPAAARRLLFEANPGGYFERFPLRPPAEVLPQAIPFPLPDPPGRR